MWQKIETAPRDGTRIILFTTTEGDVDMEEYLALTQAGPVKEVQVGWWDGIGWQAEMIGNPTHWMPLPEPPNA